MQMNCTDYTISMFWKSLKFICLILVGCTFPNHGCTDNLYITLTLWPDGCPCMPHRKLYKCSLHVWEDALLCKIGREHNSDTKTMSHCCVM